MKLNFTWLNARKSLIFNSFIDFSLFSYFFLNAFKYSILNNSVLLILCFVNSFIWIISSYIIGRYENEQIKNTNIFIRQLLKTFLNISINILINQIIFRSFWNWDYMNFESFSNFLNVFLDFYKIIFIFSSLTQSLINLYLVKRFINKSTWLFLGTRDREKYFKNLISKKSKFKIRKYNYKNIISKSINVKGIIIDDDELFKKKDIQFLFELNNKGIKIMKISNWCERYLNRFPSELVKVSEIIEGQFSHDRFSFRAKIKRTIESILSLIILIFTFPIILISGLLIKIEDGGPIFYSQVRNGFGGKQFKIIKLRTMIPNAEKDGEQWADRFDNRITKTGKFLRKLRIDELPQLLLVLSGEMSLIGPRPERPKIDILLRKHIQNYDLRYSIKPGISGWAQVNYPYGASIEDSKLKLSYDIYYIKNFSILLDFMIFFKTLKIILNRKGSIPNYKNKKNIY